MTALLTWNGIPPQIIGSLTEEQRQDLVCYAPTDKKETYYDWQKRITAPIKPFANIVAGVANSFLHWGVSIDDESLGSVNEIKFHSSHLEIGETTFKDDQNLHSDMRAALPQLRNDRLLYLRLLCVSSAPSDFIDLTREENIDAVLDPHRINNGRVYKPELLTLAQTKGQIVKPDPWDVIVFDSSTPHNPIGAFEPNQRILQHAWIKMLLPPDWQTRVKSGDAPKLRL